MYIMDYLFEPKSVVVIGASAKEGKAGHTILSNLKDNFKGDIYAVNPKYKEIEGIKCYPSVLGIKRKVDLAVVVVNENVANSVIEEAMKKGVKGIVVITAGYKEIGGEGIRREEELKSLLYKYKYSSRVVGPNCLGIYDNNSMLNVLFVEENKVKVPSKGNISLIFQSGALGEALMDRFSVEDIGISRFVSYGNAVDLDEIDFLEYFGQDKKTEVVGIYLEGTKNGRKLYDVLKKVSPRKPVVVVKGGKSEKGRKAAVSHTGSLAGNYEIFKGMAKQTNITLAENFEEFEDYLKAFSFYPSLKSNKIVIITNGGGFGVLASDEVEKYGLELYEFNHKEKNTIASSLPDYASIHNPLDLIGDADAQRYDKALSVVEHIKDIDGILVIMLVQTFSLNEEIVDVIIKHSKSSKKKIFAVVDGSDYATKIKNRIKDFVPTYPTTNKAIKSMSVLWEREKRR